MDREKINLISVGNAIYNNSIKSNQREFSDKSVFKENIILSVSTDLRQFAGSSQAGVDLVGK